MGDRGIRCGAVGAAFLVSLSLTAPGQLSAADVEADFAATTEATIGKERVVLLSVTRSTEFVPGDGGTGPRGVTSLRVMVLREWLGERVPVLTASEVEVFAAGSTDKPLRFVGNSHTILNSSKNYRGYDDEWSGTKLPAVKDPNLATVYGMTLRDVQLTTKKADVRVKVGEGAVVFKNVPLD